MTARRFLEGLRRRRRARARRCSPASEISSANSADTVAARDLGGIAHVDDDPAPSIAGGNQSLPLALAEGLDVRLSAPVERIAWSAERRSAGNGELEADACVVAVPATVLHRIAFEPALPQQLVDALGARAATARRPSCSCRCATRRRRAR